MRRAATKQQLRRELADRIKASLPSEMDRMYGWISGEEVQGAVGRYLDMLAKRKR